MLRAFTEDKGQIRGKLEAPDIVHFIEIIGYFAVFTQNNLSSCQFYGN